MVNQFLSGLIIGFVEGSEEALVSSFISQDRKWNLNSLSQMVPWDILTDIKSVHIPSNFMKDKLFWGL